MWSEDNLKNYPYLLINQLTDQSGNPQAIGPASYVESPDIPPAMGALLQLTEQDMTDVLGNQQAADQMVSNISGKAVEMIQTRLDMQSFIYMSNMAKAVKRCGEVWLSMARDVFVESGRKMKGIGNQGQIESIELAKPVMNEKGEIEYENDLAGADLDVAVDVGPSSASKRQSTVQALTGMMQITQDPETLQVLSAMAMMNMDGEGISDVRDYFRKRLIRMGVVKPTDEEQQELMAEMQNQQPDAQTQYFQAAASQANAAAAKAKADTILSVAKAKETEAKIIETLSNIDISQRDNILKSVQAIVESGISGGGMPQPDQQAINTASAQPSSMGEQAMGS
jgi:hypothetical protein